MSKTKLIVRESDSGWSNYFCYLKTARLYPIFGDPFLVNSEEPDFYNSLMNDRYGVETKNLYKNFQIFVKKQINGLNLEVVKWKNNKTSYEFWVYKKGYLLYKRSILVSPLLHAKSSSLYVPAHFLLS